MMKYIVILFLALIAGNVSASQSDYIYLSSNETSADCVGGSVVVASSTIDRTIEFMQITTDDLDSSLIASSGIVYLETNGLAVVSIAQNLKLKAGDDLLCYKTDQANQSFYQIVLADSEIQSVSSVNDTILRILIIISIIAFVLFVYNFTVKR